MRALKFLIPLVLFTGLSWFLLKGLSKDPREIPSPLIGKAVPVAALPVLGEAARNWSPADMSGQVWMLNVWGSWCSGCQAEHPLLNEFSRQNIAPVIGFAWKDAPEASSSWIAKLGNPYKLTVMDRDGKVAIDWGVYGAPETFVIDKKGVIRDKFIGPLTQEALAGRLIPLIRKLQGQ